LGGNVKAERLMSTRKTAERLGISVASVRRKIANGEIPARRSGPGASWHVEIDRLERQMADDRASQERARGRIMGYDPDEFARNVETMYGSEAADIVRASQRSGAIGDEVDKLFGESDAAELAKLDRKARFEEQAREIAARVRDRERLMRRVEELLNEWDEEED
jgi:excisionase family DNA binding protein